MPPFNPQTPFNTLPPLPPNFDFNQVAILKAVNSANIALAELKGQSLVLPNVSVLMHPLLIRESVESSEIENIHTTIDSVFQAEQIAESSRSKADKEILNYRKAILKGYELLKQNSFLHTNGIVEMHSILEPNKKGIRKTPVSIQDRRRNTVLYTPPTGETLLRDLLKNFEKYFNEYDKEPDPLVRMALLHYQFEAIHPFLDGNGRTGRMLMVLYLVAQKRLDYPLLFISEYINTHKNTYYRLLREITEKENWKEWILFLLEAVHKQSIETSKKILSIRALIETQKEKWRDTYSGEFIEYFFEWPYVTQNSLAERFEITRQTASKRLSLMQKSTVIKSLRRGRKKLYYFPEFLKILG